MAGLEITRIGSADDKNLRYCAILSIQASKKQLDEGIVKELSAMEDVILIEEL